MVKAIFKGEDESFDSNETTQWAVALHRKEHLKAAERLYRTVLEKAPQHPDALHWLGVLLCTTERLEEGRGLIEQSIGLVPEHPDFYNNYANILQANKEFQEAEKAYRRCLDLHSDQAQVLCNLGACLRNLGRPEDAVQVYEQALAASSDYPDSYQHLAETLLQLGKFNDAVDAFKEAIKKNPENERTFYQLSRIYYAAGNVDQAAEIYRHWLEVNPASSFAHHMLAACTGQDVPDKSSDEVVRETFDQFANSFDDVLDRLDYCAPQVIFDQASKCVTVNGTELDILDLGCGTGLCASFFKPWSRLLVGVDLSSGMLDKARERELYDELHEAELVAFLEQSDRQFDLIICADTLCYFGDLSAAFKALRRVLRPNGRFIFSVESADGIEDGRGYVLHPHGRYSHRTDYLQSELAKAGFILETKLDTSLRTELKKPVAGLVIVAQDTSQQCV